MTLLLAIFFSTVAACFAVNTVSPKVKYYTLIYEHTEGQVHKVGASVWTVK